MSELSDRPSGRDFVARPGSDLRHVGSLNIATKPHNIRVIRYFTHLDLAFWRMPGGNWALTDELQRLLCAVFQSTPGWLACVWWDPKHGTTRRCAVPSAIFKSPNSFTGIS